MIRLELWRELTSVCTKGNLYVDGIWQCFTLEPVQPIPAGEYQITMEFWEKKKRFYPLLHDVPGHTGIFIHSGNHTEDTKGCILVGLRNGDDYILDSIKALEQLKVKIAAALELGKVTIRVFNHPAVFGDI